MKRRRKVPDSGSYPLEGTISRSMCGWCITGHHDHCRGEFVSSLTRATYVCSCGTCHKDAK